MPATFGSMVGLEYDTSQVALNHSCGLTAPQKIMGALDGLDFDAAKRQVDNIFSGPRTGGCINPLSISG